MANNINDDNMIATRIPETDYFTPDTFNIENANHDSKFPSGTPKYFII